jgi:hypothetical protein
MTADVPTVRPVLRHSRDAVLIALSMMHGALLLTVPSVPLVALGLWWNANTVAHNFIHRPFFRDRRLNRLYSLALSVILGFPQAVWRERHLAHHADRLPVVRMSRPPAVELLFVLVTWAVCLWASPRVFAFVYLPGWALGMGLCWLQGHYEHARGTTSHYGALYNLLFFNDGYHVEHHRQPGVHWTRLPSTRTGTSAEHHAVSRWPPILRWLEVLSLDGLERIVLRVPVLQRVVLVWHERALRRLMPSLGSVRSVVIVGGGLFPRTALVLRRMRPELAITILDARQEHLDIAGRFLDDRVVLRQGFYVAAQPLAADLVVIPMAFIGVRPLVYVHPPAGTTLVHDWVWHRRGRGAVVSWLLLKRINLIEQPSEAQAAVALSA